MQENEENEKEYSFIFECNKENEGFNFHDILKFDQIRIISITNCILNFKKPYHSKLNISIDFNQIEYLDLSKSSINPLSLHKIMPYLKQIKNLKYLSLYRVFSGLEEVTLLKDWLNKLDHLMHLKLGQNDFPDFGINHLIPSLSKMKNLITLNLDNNEISYIVAIPLSEALKQMKKLVYLSLSSNGIHQFGGIKDIIDSIMDIAHNFEYLNLMNNPIKDGSHLVKLFEKFKVIQYFNLKNARVDYNSLKSIMELSLNQENLAFIDLDQKFEHSFNVCDSKNPYQEKTEKEFCKKYIVKKEYIGLSSRISILLNDIIERAKLNKST